MTRTIPLELTNRLGRNAVLAIWSGAAQTSGHRSSKVRYPQTVDRIVAYVRSEGARQPTTTVAGTVLYRFAGDQPFGDCNKRTGLIIATELMEDAGFHLVRPDQEVWLYLNRFATNHPSLDAFLEWFRDSFEVSNRE
ncbi:MAG: hypothetical protein WBF81_03420 [Thermoplasmata archaeon]